MNAWTRQAAASLDYGGVQLAHAREPASADSSMSTSFYCSGSAELQSLSQFVSVRLCKVCALLAKSRFDLSKSSGRSCAMFSTRRELSSAYFFPSVFFVPDRKSVV